MGLPTYQEVMLPILKIMADGEIHSIKEFVSRMEQEFNLTEDEKQVRISSGTQRTI